MDGDELAKAGRALHACTQRKVIDVRELVDAAGAHERLEPNDTAGVQFLELVEIVRHQSAPQGEIGEGTGFGCRPLLIEAVAVERGGMGIERHVEEYRATARRQGARAGFDSFPMRAARFIEVDMGIDKAWENVEARGIDHLAG